MPTRAPRHGHSCVRPRRGRTLDHVAHLHIITRALGLAALSTVSETSTPLLELMARTRAETMSLVSTLEPDDHVVQTAPYTSPPKWHVGHVSWVFEMVIRKLDTSYAPTPMAESPYLNSYYRQAGSPHPKAERGAVSRPTARELLDYHGEVTRRLGDAMRHCKGAAEAQRLLAMAIHHECQHQELMVYDLQHMLASAYEPASRTGPPAPALHERPRSVRIGGGTRRVGHDGRGYSYDIEMLRTRFTLMTMRLMSFR